MHIADVIKGHLAALEYGRRGERYILAGENLPVIQLIHLIAEISGVPAPTLVLPAGLVRASSGLFYLTQRFLALPVSVDTLRQAGRYFYYDNRKALSELKLAPPLPVKEALQEAYQWFIQVGAI